MRAFAFAMLLLASQSSHGMAIKLNNRAAVAVNPIRKVVTMLQNMQAKVTEEGKQSTELFDKYMCYCKNGADTLGKSIAEAENKIPQIESALGEDGAEKTQLEADLVAHKADRIGAKDAIAAAKAMREKGAAEFAKVAAELRSNIDALSKAIPAIETGMAGPASDGTAAWAGLLQTGVGSVLRRLSVSMDMNSGDRETLAAFLSGGSSYVPQSGEIVGILKTMKDEMDADLASEKAAEAEAIQAFEGLLAAKAKEIEALTKAIETKMERVGALGVKLAEMANDLDDTKDGLADDQAFLADLDKNCATKEAEMAEYKKTMSEELVALADTIKVLNDDDALELFKKTLPSAASSLVQLQMTTKSLRTHALSVLRGSKGSPKDTRLDLLEMALHGGKVGFEKIITMIDDLVAVLKKEQADDDAKQQYCETEFDTSDDKKKSLEHSIADLEKVIADAEETIATLASEISALEDSIKALDKDVATQTEQRKDEHAEFVKTLADNNAAKDILGFAKNRLNKFYNPKLYVPPPKRELTEDEQITVGFGGTLAPTPPPAGIAGTGIGLVQDKVAPPPPPEANLAYKKKGEASSGVIAMIDLIVRDLEKEILEMEMTEKEAQSDYEKFMSDSATKRAMESKEITDKTAAKAATEEELESNKEAMSSTQTSLMETMTYIAALHADCDWLLKYHSTRASARVAEIEALGNAKDVLKGADY